MNNKIKEILEKHISLGTLGRIPTEMLNSAIIEICEEQKNECAENAKIRFFDGFHKEGKLIAHFQSGVDNLTPSKDSILNSKNIAK